MLNDAPAPMVDTVIKRRPLDAPFGCELIGVDLTREIDEMSRDAIYDAWINASILLFRDIRNDDAAQMRLSHIRRDGARCDGRPQRPDQQVHDDARL